MLGIIRVLLIVVVVGVRLVTKQDWLGNVWLVVGWMMGYLLAEADHWFYVWICNPQELSCQRIKKEIMENKNWKNAWGMLKNTREERIKLPIHNILTGLLIAFLGIWVVTSLGNLLVSGIVVGLGVKLFTDFVGDDYKKWYWVFAREFSEIENRVVTAVWALLLAISLVVLL